MVISFELFKAWRKGIGHTGVISTRNSSIISQKLNCTSINIVTTRKLYEISNTQLLAALIGSRIDPPEIDCNWT